ncbi:MAG: DUF3007 family protein [Chloroflexaceae bacterium]|nr:DUF3007 family protein [Chloroflexaceae bacterium]
MRRIDAIAIALGVLVAGGLAYGILQWAGLDNLTAGIWTQLLLVVGLVGWTATYLLRVLSHKMTYNQQIKDYEEAVLRKRYEELSPDELAKLQAEIEQEKQQSSPPKE